MNFLFSISYFGFYPICTLFFMVTTSIYLSQLFSLVSALICDMFWLIHRCGNRHSGTCGGFLNHELWLLVSFMYHTIKMFQEGRHREQVTYATSF